MKKTIILVFVFSLACVNMVFANERVQGKPNVVLFLVDDQGSDEIACYASKFHETPNIDALAEQGMKFNQAYSGATLCSPSRASILAGCSPARLHLTDWIPGQKQINRKSIEPEWQTYIDRSRTLLPEAMKEHGYSTCFLGKWHLIPRATPRERDNPERVSEIAKMYDEHMPQNNGFDENFGGDHSANQGFRFFYPEFRTFPGLEDKGKEGDCLTDVLTDCAVDYIERKKDEPFFLYFSYYTVHWPILGKPEYVKNYEKKLADNPDADYYMKNANKAAMVQSLDESVGRVIAKLKEIGQLDNTLIIFTGDNGSQSEEYVINFRDAKGSAYEGGTRVPLIISGPQIEKGISDVPVIGMDFYPTILSYIGAPLKPEEHMDGVDITPILTGNGEIKDRPLYWHYPHYDNYEPHSIVLADGWKVIRYDDDGRIELYNLNIDQMEENDLAATYPEKTKKMVRELDRFLTGANAQKVIPNPEYDPDPNKYSGGIRGYKQWQEKPSEK
jgi:arylsulfatase A